MATVRGGAVRPHVQAFADAVQAATGAQSFGTYAGHQPTTDRALDIFVPVNSATLGNAICDFALKNLKRFGVDYVIYRQRIYNPEISPNWRAMADRGGVTQNHFDHVHVSFEPTAAATPVPAPPPKEEDDLTPEQDKMLKDIWSALFTEKPRNLHDAITDAANSAKNAADNAAAVRNKLGA